MFEHLRDPDPPQVLAVTRGAVAARATRIRRRGQMVRAAMAFLLVVVVGGGAVVNSRRGTTDGTTVEVAGSNRTCCGTIEGTVRDAAGPLKGITVSLLLLGRDAPSPEDPSPWNVTAEATADGSGRVVFTDLEAGTYAVRAEDHPDALLKKVRHQPAFFAGAAILSRATPLVVEPDRTVPVDLTLELTPTTTIAGDVRESTQRFPIAGITVKLFQSKELTRETTSDATGSYDLGGVAAGTYTLEFVDGKGADRSPGLPFRSIWYAGPDRPEGSFTSIPLTVAGVNVTANITLVR